MARIAVDVRSVHRHQGGIGRVADRLTRALVALDAGHAWHLLHGRSLPDGFEMSHGPNHERHACEAIQIDPVWEQLHLPTVLERLKADLYHATCFAVPVARGDVRTVATVHDVVFRVHPELVDETLRTYLDRWTEVALDLADAVVTVSTFSRDEIVRCYGVDPARIDVISNGVDMQEPAPADVERVRRERDLPARFALYLASIEPKKNVTVLLDAWATGLVEVPLVVAGGGGPRALDLPAEVARRGVGDRVRILGYVPDADVAPLMAAASVFAYPSLYEGFGLPPLEAMAVGTPTVVADATSLPEVVGDAALRADPRDPQAWADAIARILDDELLAERLRRAGHARSAELSWERSAHAHLALYDRVLAGAPAR